MSENLSAYIILKNFIRSLTVFNSNMKILLVDGHSIAHRSFHALLAQNLTAPDGTPTGMLTGFINMFFKAWSIVSPDKIIAMFDAGGKNFRHEIFSDYKATRKPLDDKFKIQLPLLESLLKFIGCPVISEHGVEADDLIASFAEHAKNLGHEIYILSSDKDLLQLLDDNVKMIRPISKGLNNAEIYDTQKFYDEYKFAPELMADYLTLVGDSVDNIKGVEGIGIKTAPEIISEFGSVEDIYKNIDKLAPRIKRKFEITSLEEILKTREIIYLQKNLISDEIFNTCLNFKPDFKKARELALELGLRKFLARVDKLENENFTTQDFDNVSENLHEHEFEFENENTYITNDINLPENIFTDFKSELENDYEHYKNYDVTKIFDLRTAHYLLHPDISSRTFSIMLDKLKARENFAQAVIEEAMKFSHEIKKYNDLESVMNDIDLPLIPVLVKMQHHGIRVDRKALFELSYTLQTRINDVESVIANLTGRNINLQSAKQVSELLFGDLGFEPEGKINKAGYYSTKDTVLKKLASSSEKSEIPKLLLEHRTLTTVQNSFVIPYQKMADKNNILRTVFEPAMTATGRLSSRYPNFQNIPAYGEWADKLKAALLPVEDGNIFISADYSQIELRVLAFLSGEEKLLEAFQKGRDIHTETAAQVFKIEPEFVTQELRRAAKMINYGLLYGMNAYGLADRLTISKDEAKNIMEKYFKAFPKIESYTNNLKATGNHTKTYYGRIRNVNEISANGKADLQRSLINAPIQGTAADIARKAMIACSNECEGLFLQVHDSLICECPKNRENEFKNILKEIMTGINKDIILEVNLKSGNNLAYV